MAVKLTRLRGITEDLAARLQERNITTSDELLAACQTPAKRQELAKFVGVDRKLITEAAHRADLTRVCGVDAAYVELLEYAGVKTVRDCATHQADTLQVQLVQAHAKLGCKQPVPTLSMVAQWVHNAQKLPPMLEH